MIKVYIEDNEIFGPIAHDIKGLRKGAETLLNQINNALAYTADGLLTVDWAMADVTPKLRQRVILVQSA